MLDQPWPPPGPGPQQPRDAHRQHWANDVRPAVSPPGDPWVGSGREPAARRRADDALRHDDTDTAPRGLPPFDPRDLDARDLEPRERPASRRLPARWVPEEEWIPQPTVSPEQLWTQEQDWLAAFAARQVVAPPVRTRRWALRYLVAAGCAVVLAATVVVVLVAAL